MSGCGDDCICDFVYLIFGNTHLEVSECGRIVRFDRRSNRWQVAGDSNTKGYKHIYIGKKSFLQHRLVYYAFHSDFDIYDDKIEIDHDNHNEGDNRIENLRIATRGENCRNRKNQKCSKTKIKGVYPYNDYRRNSWFWRIQIKKDKKIVFNKTFKGGNGSYPNPLPPVPQHIIDLRNEKLLEHHGTFACLEY